MIGNFGVAIIGLTVIVRLLLFPIAQKQFASMAKMRIVQPKMKALQERYKDDRAKLQEEMMKLYREEKVNPMAGCLPILLQIPIFYALYKVLLVSVEMRHEPFALWIRDLSAPDPLTPVNLFGLLPFTPPAMRRDRRAADPRRLHHVAAAEAQSADARSGAAPDLRAHALGADGGDGAVRGRPADLLGDQQSALDPPAAHPLRPPPGAQGSDDHGDAGPVEAHGRAGAAAAATATAASAAAAGAAREATAARPMTADRRQRLDGQMESWPGSSFPGRSPS